MTLSELRALFLRTPSGICDTPKAPLLSLIASGTKEMDKFVVMNQSSALPRYHVTLVKCVSYRVEWRSKSLRIVMSGSRRFHVVSWVRVLAGVGKLWLTS